MRIILAVFLIPSLLFAEIGSPIGTVQKTVDQILKVVQENPGEENKAARRQAIKDVIGETFDFEEMSKRSLGAHWKKCSEEEQKEFVHVFSEFLAKTYIDRVEEVQPGMVKIESEKLKDNKALVKTKVDYKGEMFPLDYKMVNRENNWRVYDVVIENIGLVANYRNEFAGILRKNKFSGLMQKLKKKVETT